MIISQLVAGPAVVGLVAIRRNPCGRKCAQVVGLSLVRGLKQHGATALAQSVLGGAVGAQMRLGLGPSLGGGLRPPGT